MMLYLLDNGFIGVAIGATNLIPFPLDGSKMLLLLIEGIRKPIPPEREALFPW